MSSCGEIGRRVPCDTHSGLQTRCKVVVVNSSPQIPTITHFPLTELAVEEIVLSGWVEILVFLTLLGVLKRVIYLSRPFIAFRFIDFERQLDAVWNKEKSIQESAAVSIQLSSLLSSQTLPKLPQRKQVGPHSLSIPKKRGTETSSLCRPPSPVCH